MVYFEKDGLVIRDLCPADVTPIVTQEQLQGVPHVRRDLYEMRLRDAAAGRCFALCAVVAGQPVGWVNLYFRAYPPYDQTNWPEILAFGVLASHRRRGIGTALLDTVEQLAAERSDTVCLGVGLHSGYGAAQRLYVRRGYIPDGTGVWYAGHELQPYAPCVNDDDLNLYLTKKLR